MSAPQRNGARADESCATTLAHVHETVSRAAIQVRRQTATQAVFLLAGYGRAAWAPLVPFVKARLVLDDGQLGLLLLCLGVGSVIAMPFSGAWTAWYGCRKVIVTASLTLCAALLALSYAGDVASTACMLILFGMDAGTLDVAMNIQAIEVERRHGHAIMSGFHAFYSVGGIAGAAGPSLLLSLGLAVSTSTVIAVVLIFAVLAYAYTWLLTWGPSDGASLLCVPRGIVILLGSLTFLAFLAESAVLDWSGVFLTSERRMNPANAGFGYAVFAATMTAGRLAGDRVVRSVGASRVAVVGGLCAAIGFLMVALVPFWQVSLLGYALVGAGISNVAPVLFSAVGRQTAMPVGAAVSSMTTIGYCGIFTGPAVIGAIARFSTLSSAFLFTAILAVVIAFGVWRVFRHD